MTEVTRGQSLFVISQLADESDSDLQVWPPRVQILKRLDHGPVVFAHQKGGQDTGRATLAAHRVHQHALTPLGS